MITNNPPDTFFDEALKAIRDDPEAVIREKRTVQVASLKLMIPEQILANRKLRRKNFEQFEQAQKQADDRKLDISLAVKSEKDLITNKIKYHNKESRESEVANRLANDGAYQSWWRIRNNMYADVKGLDDEISYLEKIDQSLLEIMAMFTALIESDTANKSYKLYKARNSKRNAERIKEDESILEETKLLIG